MFVFAHVAHIAYRKESCQLALPVTARFVLEQPICKEYVHDRMRDCV